MARHLTGQAYLQGLKLFLYQPLISFNMLSKDEEYSIHSGTNKTT